MWTFFRHTAFIAPANCATRESTAAKTQGKGPPHRRPSLTVSGISFPQLNRTEYTNLKVSECIKPLARAAAAFDDCDEEDNGRDGQI
jgi:hypothetical protein